LRRQNRTIEQEIIMSYKTVLQHADASRSAATRLGLAALLAEQQQAHLVCAAMTGISRYAYRSGGPAGSDLAARATQNAEAVLGHCRTLTEKLGVQSCEHRLVDDDAYGGLTLQSRYADLIVVGQADSDDPATGGLLQDLPGYLVLNCCRPVLVVPFAGNFPAIGRQVLIAWDGGLQATRAIASALPLLRGASRVTLALFDPASGKDEHGEEPGADMALYLARHGIKVDVVRQSSDGDVGEALLSMADSVGADLVVMGAYGHERYQEILLGGVTRTVLNTMTVPVLLAH
jgi:nucleotide-binding universal stress UspA family protein